MSDTDLVPEIQVTNRKFSEKKAATLWKPGQSGNPAGRPKGKTLTETLKEFMAGVPEGQTLTYRELFIQQSYKKAMQGDPTFAKLVWNYIDGMPKQKLEHSGPEGGPIPILSGITAHAVPGNDGHQEDTGADKAD